MIPVVLWQDQFHFKIIKLAKRPLLRQKVSWKVLFIKTYNFVKGALKQGCPMQHPFEFFLLLSSFKKQKSISKNVLFKIIKFACSFLIGAFKTTGSFPYKYFWNRSHMRKVQFWIYYDLYFLCKWFLHEVPVS